MSTKDIQAKDYLLGLSRRVQEDFETSRTILSFREWFEILLQHPARNLRSAAQYTQDAFNYYGTVTRDLPQGKVERFRLFDAPWSIAQTGSVAGHEQVQHEVYRLLSNFVRDGRVSKLILLHGPNGSAKSTLVHAIQAALENYSRTKEGALYTYAWIFPSEKVAKGRLGFGEGATKTDSSESYAHLASEQIDALLPCELSDHPIFFLPRAERLTLFEGLKASGRLDPEFVLSQYILDGDLSPRDRSIYDSLLKQYEGRHEDVLRHVQVQRFYVSAKYGRGVGTVEPQDAVDAHAEQITADRSLGNLPRPLQNVSLFRLWGPLVAANRGILEYADILKRPLDWLKYLLSTSEEATASLPQFKIQLDEILIASTNETYLEAFKKNPDWNSFKGRMELVPVPYLRRFTDEVQIYRRQIAPGTIAKPMAPHVVEVAALWAVLTRLKKPDKAHYPAHIKTVVDRLTPLDKVKLYDTGEVPNWCTAHEAKELRRFIETMLEESTSSTEYEGHIGASAREIRTLILNAAHDPHHRSVTPLAVFDQFRDLVRDPSVYDFLRLKGQDGFYEAEDFIRIVRDWWLDILDGEVRGSMGLVEETKYEERFAKYVVHVSHYLKKEKLFDKITGKFENPDEDMMREVEGSIVAQGEHRDDFRRAVIAQIGAWGLDNAGKTPDYRKLFHGYIEKLESDFYRERKKQISKTIVTVLKRLGNEEVEATDEEKAVADRTLATLQKKHGYPDVCIAECLSYLLRERYSKDTR